MTETHNETEKRNIMPRIACVGGFLGSGKTTAIIEAARIITARGLRVGIVTNDQGKNLVDTALVTSHGFPAEEISGGCFCCKFEDFARHSHRLVERFRTDVILAEAVGSCTDLSATVCSRLRIYHSTEFEVAPLTIMVDPDRAREMSATSAGFADTVKYLFEKQLAEADLIVLTKSDLMSDKEVSETRELIRRFNSGAPIHVISAKTASGVSQWVEDILTASAGERKLELDYETYGQAESTLAWLNATVDVSSHRQFRPRQLCEHLMSSIQRMCAHHEFAVAHIKIMFVTAEGNDWIALTNSGGHPAWGMMHGLSPCNEASVIINARICTAPDELRRIIEHSIGKITAEQKITAAVSHVECFSPKPPTRPVMLEIA